MPASARWMRDVLPDTPRFLSALPPSTEAFDPGERLQLIKEPRRLASLGSWVPLPESAREPAPPAGAGSPDAAPAPPAASPPPAAVLAATIPAAPLPIVERASAAILVAQAAPPQRTAQATGSSAPPSPSRDQVESLVALLVGYYDSGNAEQVVGLVDPDHLGWFGGLRLRGAYADFFAATSSRRLRMEQLAWRQSGALAQARGEATVVAEYADGRPRLERRVPVELDIGLREGQARITRLVLFPGGQ